jgi:hypothetical protein
MKILSMLITSIVAIAAVAGAANSLPVSNAWNIAPRGDAESSGELHFRMTAGEADPVDITVPIMSGAKEASIARYIQRALSSQLRAHQLNVENGEGANVLVTSSANASFSLELVTSDVENVRVAVQSATPIAPPTVPRQATPANPPATPSTPPGPGDAVPPADAQPPANASQPAASPPVNSPPMSNPAPPPNATTGAGAPAGAPPPNAAPGGTPSSTPPPTA